MSADIVARGLASRAQKSASTRALIAAIRTNGALTVGAYRIAANDVPSFTLSASGANSALNGRASSNPMVTRTDPRLTPLSGVPTLVGSGYPQNLFMWSRGAYYGAKDGGGAPLRSGLYHAWEFSHTGTSFDLPMLCSSAGPVRVLVDGTVAGTYSNALGDGSLRFLKIDFPASRTRRIAIETSGPAFNGVNLVNDADCKASGRDFPLITVIGDSFVEPTGVSLGALGEAAVMGRALGCNTAVAGVGGSGLLVTGGNNSAGFPKTTWQNATRLLDLTLGGVVSDQTGAAASPALGVVMLSLNDPGTSANWGGAATAQEAVAKACWVLIDAWTAANPGKPLVFFGPTWPNENPTQDSFRVRDGALESCAGAALKNVWFIDRLEPGPLLRKGASGATGANSQAELYTSNQFGDTTHPNQAGHQLDGLWMAAQVRRLILTEFA